VARKVNDLRGVSEHLYYEFWMLHDVALSLYPPTWPLQGVPGWQVNALLESFTIHARNLVRFFYDGRTGGYPESKSRRGANQYRNAYADDFFDDATWRRSRPKPKPEALQKIDARVAQEIVHLTYNRITIATQARQWDYRIIWQDLARCMQAFLDVVPRDRVADDFVAQVEALLPPRPGDPDRAVKFDPRQGLSAATSVHPSTRRG
jgi:hypothetical protein